LRASLASAARRARSKRMPPKNAPTSATSHRNGRVALGGCPPRAPTDPDVRALAHPVLQHGSFTIRNKADPEAIRPSDVDMQVNLDVFGMFPRASLPANASLPSTGSSGASSPPSTVLSKRYDFLTPISPRFVSFAWRYHPLCRKVCVSRRSRHELAGQAVLERHPLRSRVRGWRRQDLPSSWGTPIVHRHMFFDPGRLRASHPSDAAPRPPL
jgi:hypothetical protein